MVKRAKEITKKNDPHSFANIFNNDKERRIWFPI
jgi:hypothetical protein